MNSMILRSEVVYKNNIVKRCQVVYNEDKYIQWEGKNAIHSNSGSSKRC